MTLLRFPIKVFLCAATCSLVWGPDLISPDRLKELRLGLETLAAFVCAYLASFAGARLSFVRARAYRMQPSRKNTLSLETKQP